ncbi:hypothetical protein [Thioalkalivibrio sp. ALJT]|uniref:hypothetical protein n=1 Tax=Thioalkalivibrio sp. ALJT TaxID=1158146 RepID=UPI0009DB1425|nr:hypothetical protein [Thioalkalivibrio sp. ALJT]
MSDVKRVFRQLLCWMLVAAIAGLPAVAAAVGMEGGHAGHAAMHGTPSADDSHVRHAQTHAHGADRYHHGRDHDQGAARHDHHRHGQHAGHAADSHHDHHGPVSSDTSHLGDPLGHADCVDASCLASCSACGHCQGMPVSSGTGFPALVRQAMRLYSFQSGPPAAAIYRPPILS